MLSAALQKRVHHLEIQTRRILSGSLLGDFRTSKKGFGLDFEQLAEYQFGDDIRFIDWKSSARTNKILVKEYTEERNRTIMLVVDGSLSQWYGTSEQLKHERVAEIASVIALACNHYKDQVGLIIMTDELELFVPPKSGKKHCNAIIEKLFTFKPKACTTKLAKGLQHLMKMKQHDMLAILISDFIDSDFEKDLRVVSQKHEVAAIACLDAFEQKIPQIGLIECEDIETGERFMFNTHDMRIIEWLEKRYQALDKLMKKYRIDCFKVMPTVEFLPDLVKFFARKTR
jgi:uncharacterized protein (DUF58 family)